MARKLVVQVWHLLRGHLPTGLETDRSLTLKLHRLTMVLGRKLRAELGLPATLKTCVVALRQRILDPGPS